MRRLAVAVLLLAAPAWALTLDEVIELSKAKVADDVIIAKIKADGSRFPVSVSDILRMKKEGVSDAVIRVVVETCDYREPVQQPPAGAPRGRAAGGGTSGPPANLAVTNSDPTRGYSIQVDPRGGNLFVYYDTMRDREVVRAGEARTIDVPSGNYRLRWVGEPRIYDVPVAPGRQTEIRFSSSRKGEAEEVSVEVLVDGRRVDGGPLKSITPAITPTRNRWGGFPSPEEQASIHAGQPATVVQAPTTYYYPQGYSYLRTVECPRVVYHRSGYYGCGCDSCCRYRGGYYGGYRSHSLFGPNTLFWTAVGGAIGAANDEVGAGLGAGFLFGHLLDHSFGY